MFWLRRKTVWGAVAASPAQEAWGSFRIGVTGVSADAVFGIGG
jgi:hypothetical protein